ncbi:uncharacterized protein LOC101852505 [Aplysia californica]|uniref:Uncharacterized protein LOC101852505 n=1 Tax=Aplysia californica TaxID=6500 RepID=A0ABM0K3G4_APLCA|nr:uncharacterized protein LOC101852505 [Aplysia californica]
MFAYTDLAPIFDPVKNKTLIGIIYNDNEDAIKPVVMIAGFIVTAGSYLCVSVFSALLIYALIQRRRKWKCSKNMSTSKGNTPTQNKDIQVAKMILLVAAVFLIGFIPLGAVFLVMELVPGFYIGKAYENENIVCVSVLQIVQGINSSINILLYIKMSSKYRRTIRALFRSLKQMEPNLD